MLAQINLEDQKQYLVIHFQGSNDPLVGINQRSNEFLVLDKLSIPNYRLATEFRLAKAFLNPFIGLETVCFAVHKSNGIHKVVGGLGRIRDAR